MYKKHQSKEDKFFTKVMKIIFTLCVVAAFAAAIGSAWGEIKNLSTEEIWNYGICPTCNEKYKLLKIKNNKSYYQCPKCKTEVIRYKEIIKRKYACYGRNLYTRDLRGRCCSQCNCAEEQRISTE